MWFLVLSKVIWQIYPLFFQITCLDTYIATEPRKKPNNLWGLSFCFINNIVDLLTIQADEPDISTCFGMYGVRIHPASRLTPNKNPNTKAIFLSCREMCTHLSDIAHESYILEETHQICRISSPSQHNFSSL